ncbi:hypothetical protein [Chitinophaga qingshengii]|uniref:Uncharacterized protein n=1 Tax=Chitinophaga qingshengii TaxID=1569794 RepID=A0ABR7TW63_9BACT|nr:hypothetical protein [Chitinophaga qingshengii]MBC9934726.1 hypothetical protein [Chitinophaga qingshengii]
MHHNNAIQPVNKIRKQMKQEGMLQVLGLILLSLLPRYLTMNSTMTVGYYCLYAVTMSISAYYLFKFYLFYQRLTSADLSTREHLYSTYYEIKIHLEMYRAFSYIIVVLALGFITMYGMMEVPYILKIIDGNVDAKVIMVLVVAFVGLVALIGAATEWGLDMYYGKYVKEIRGMITDLTTVE